MKKTRYHVWVSEDDDMTKPYMVEVWDNADNDRYENVERRFYKKALAEDYAARLRRRLAMKAL